MFPSSLTPLCYIPEIKLDTAFVVTEGCRTRCIASSPSSQQNLIHFSLVYLNELKCSLPNCLLSCYILLIITVLLTILNFSLLGR